MPLKSHTNEEFNYILLKNEKTEQSKHVALTHFHMNDEVGLCLCGTTKSHIFLMYAQRRERMNHYFF